MSPLEPVIATRMSHPVLLVSPGIPVRSSDRLVRFARPASPGRYEMCEGGCGNAPATTLARTSG